jgi:AraC-like DNA-binding protein
MDDSRPAYRLDDGCQLIPLHDSPQAVGWNNSLHSEEISEGWRVSRFDFHAALQRIAQEVLACRMSGAARRIFLQSKALELLAYVIASCDAQPPSPVGLTRRDRVRVQQADELLCQRYSDPWTIASLAREVGLNERKLKQGFRQLLGRTVHDHLERTRISAAQSLLAEGGLGVTETALAVGYSNPSHFAKIFKRSVGISPSRWRRSPS